MNSKWLPLTAVAGFAAVLISQAIAPASADRHDDWVRRQREIARQHRYRAARYHRTPLHGRAWNAPSNRRDRIGFHRVPPTPWRRSNTEYREWQHH